ncbi:uncharacterized protein LOC122001697 [Zingiber officinale]|nr:uncharacterized protein LOC122001697 [Zingiber officinale]
MDDMRSRSFHDGMMQMEAYGRRSSSAAPPGLHDLRSYSATYSYSYNGGGGGYGPDDFKTKTARRGSSSSTNGGGGVWWGFSDPEFQRKRRVASYKAYSVEGKVKGSLRRSFRWIKDRYTRAVHGW